METPKIEYRISPERLRNRRDALKLSRADLANKIGMCDPAYLYQMEKGPKNCSMDLAMRLAQALECEVVDLTQSYPKP
jgi:transcriptional regulator with XRE-family HTH domain